MEDLQNTLKKLKMAAIDLAGILVKIDDDRKNILVEISREYSVQDPEPIYEKVCDDFFEGVEECMVADKFFIQSKKGLVADKTQTFLYDLWSGEYYGDCSETAALLKFADELKARKNLDFLDECAKYSK